MFTLVAHLSELRGWCDVRKRGRARGWEGERDGWKEKGSEGGIGGAGGGGGRGRGKEG